MLVSRSSPLEPLHFEALARRERGSLAPIEFSHASQPPRPGTALLLLSTNAMIHIVPPSNSRSYIHCFFPPIAGFALTRLKKETSASASMHKTYPPAPKTSPRVYQVVPPEGSQVGQLLQVGVDKLLLTVKVPQGWVNGQPLLLRPPEPHQIGQLTQHDPSPTAVGPQPQPPPSAPMQPNSAPGSYAPIGGVSGRTLPSSLALPSASLPSPHFMVNEGRPPNPGAVDRAQSAVRTLAALPQQAPPTPPVPPGRALGSQQQQQAAGTSLPPTSSGARPQPPPNGRDPRAPVDNSTQSKTTRTSEPVRSVT